MISRIRWTALVPALLLWTGSGVVAQEPIVISGTVINQAREPVAGQEVILHRVAGQTGDRIGETVTDAEGGFAFTVEGEQPSGAIFFATARFEDKTYIGSFIELPIDPDLAYEIDVGGEPISFETTTMPPASGLPAEVRPPASPRRWALAIVPLVALLGVGAAVLTRRGKRARRTLLIRLAVLEEEIEATGETEGLRRERALILDQLGGRPGN